MDTQSTLAMEGLPQKPEKPLDSDCCGNGCVPCVLDIYTEELAIWERDCARIKSGGTSHSVGQEEEENGEYEVRLLLVCCLAGKLLLLAG